MQKSHPMSLLDQESLKIEFMEKKGLREVTADHYAQSFLRLSRDVTAVRAFRDYDWLGDPKYIAEVMQHIRNTCSSGGQLNYLSVLKAAVECLSDTSGTYYESIRSFLGENIASLNNKRKLDDGENSLVSTERYSWKSYDDLLTNFEMLRGKQARKPLDFATHLRALVYSIFLHMKDICVFRRDLILTTRFGFAEQPFTEGNWIWLKPRGVSFVFNEYKTSDTYGQNIIDCPTELADELKDSYSEFPRSYVFPKIHDRTAPMQPSHATKFVKSCWVLGPNSEGPNADNIRSALVTRYFDTHPMYNERVDFARRSGSSFDKFSRCYYKVT